MFKFSDLHLCIIIIIIISKITWYVHVLVHHTNRSPIFQRITKTLTIYYRCHTSVCGLSCLTHPFLSGNSGKIPISKAKQWGKIPWSSNKIVRHIWLRNLAISSYRYHIPSQLLKHERVLLSAWQEGSGYSRMISKICKEFDYGFLPLF